MALHITLKSQFNQDLIHAVVRMDERNHKALKQYMHCKDEIAIRFPGNVALFHRGRGWYRLECVGHNYNAEQRMAFAIKVIRKFVVDAERKTTEELKRLTPIMLNPGLKVASFSNAHSEGEFGYIGKAVPKERMSVPQHKLNALVAKFARPQRT